MKEEILAMWILIVILFSSDGAYEEAVGAMQEYSSCVAYKNYTVWLHDKLALKSEVVCRKVQQKEVDNND